MVRREPEPTGTRVRVECSACGMALTAKTEQELLEKLTRHSQEQHGVDLPELKAREAIRRGTT
ncbi:MAG: DUF1059 domain-containing protein [Anaerolineae bacterium]